MERSHRYTITTTWTGNLGRGTETYGGYARAHELGREGKQVRIPGSSDPKFRGDATRYNPEELFVGSLSACHMLWYLHLCADAGVVVTGYEDSAEGTMVESPEGAGQFTEVRLQPRVRITDPAKLELARELHHRAHERCFLASSVKCPVEVDPELTAG